MNFAVWKTIKLGVGLVPMQRFSETVEKAGVRIGGWAYDLFEHDKFSVAKEEVEIDLVRLTVAELGFSNGAPCNKIGARAKELGLELCSLEVGPQLRLQYTDQPIGELLLIGTELVPDRGAAILLFGVSRDKDGLWLRGLSALADGRSYHFWPGGGNRWVFVLPRK